MLNVLVVDDHVESRYVLRFFLEQKGHRVVEANDGLQALELGRARSFDAVVADLLMPGMDGYTLCREWMRDPALREVPFIVCTGTYTEAQDQSLALELGAAHFLVKPVDPGRVLKVIEATIAERRARPAVARVLEPHQEVSQLELYNRRLRNKLDHKMAELSATESRLRDYVERMEAIADNSGDAIISFDARVRIQAWNHGAERLFGYTQEEVIGQSLALILPEQRREEVMEQYSEALLQRQARRWQSARRHRLGHEIAVDVALSPLREGLGAVVVYRDLSEQRRLEARLQQAERLEILGQMAGGIAHDFNNLLTVIRAHAELLEQSGQVGGAAQEDLAVILETTQRMSTMTRQLLAFGKRQSLVSRVTDLNAHVEGILPLLRHLLGGAVEVYWHPSESLPPVMVDESQLTQVVMNLVVNARDAMPEGGRVDIVTAYVEAPPGLVPGDVDAGSWVRLSVVDAGVGMDEGTQQRIFDPFFSTKAGGTGLGLATVYGIVTQQGGRLAVVSSPGMGTTLQVDFPASTAIHGAVPDAVAVAAEPERQLATVLVVEDDVMVLRLVKRVLAAQGYHLLLAQSGHEALALARGFDGVIHLLLTDVVMPGMNGAELAERLRQTRPETAVLFCSGYTADALQAYGLGAEGAIELLQKPFTPELLVTRVRDALAKEHQA